MGQLTGKFKAIAATILIVLIAIGAYLWSAKDPSLADGEFVKADAPIEANPLDSEIVNGIHLPTGLIADEGLNLVIANCTACHSAKLVTQNHADRAGWEKMIRWMQSSQNLWDLGTQEEIILDYLSKNYAPDSSNQSNMGRRAPLMDIEWYELKN
jgi:cytochrome c5|tara:strand:- start:1070 stop:1534 length:465 start_codon:yes stop_codon:yes gene_type:complete